MTERQANIPEMAYALDEVVGSGFASLHPDKARKLLLRDGGEVVSFGIPDGAPMTSLGEGPCSLLENGVYLVVCKQHGLQGAALCAEMLARSHILDDLPLMAVDADFLVEVDSRSVERFIDAGGKVGYVDLPIASIVANRLAAHSEIRPGALFASKNGTIRYDLAVPEPYASYAQAKNQQERCLRCEEMLWQLAGRLVFAPETRDGYTYRYSHRDTFGRIEKAVEALSFGHISFDQDFFKYKDSLPDEFRPDSDMRWLDEHAVFEGAFPQSVAEEVGDISIPDTMVVKDIVEIWEGLLSPYRISLACNDCQNPAELMAAIDATGRLLGIDYAIDAYFEQAPVSALLNR